MTFTPPKKRTHGQCTCDTGRLLAAHVRGDICLANPGALGHSAGCESLYPLQLQPGDKATSARALANGYVRTNDAAALAGAPDWLGDEPNGQARREGFNEGYAKATADAAARIQHLEARLKDYERAAVFANDLQSRALRMGQQQGRAELATELLECTWPSSTHLLDHLHNIAKGDTDT